MNRDEDLLAAFLSGDQRAFDELVGRYERYVYAICYRYFGNPADAEDAAQETFVAVLRRAHTFAGGASFSTWLYRVATNACNDLARKRARRPQRSGEDIGDRPQLAGAAPDVHTEVLSRTVGPELAGLLAELDPHTREAIVLHDVYALPYVDIAERQGVALGTVKSRIHRGHAHLAEALRDVDSPEQATPAGHRGEPLGPSRPPTGER